MAVIDNRAVKEMDEVLLGSLYEACIRCGQARWASNRSVTTGSNRSIRRAGPFEVKKLLNYVQKLREESGLVTIRSAHTVGSIIRAHGVNEDDGESGGSGELRLRRALSQRPAGRSGACSQQNSQCVVF